MLTCLENYGAYRHTLLHTLTACWEILDKHTNIHTFSSQTCLTWGDSNAGSTHTLNPRSQHHTHLMLMSETITCTLTKPHTHTKTLRGLSHHITSISTGGKRSPLAHRQHVCNKQINTDTKRAILSFWFEEKQSTQLCVFTFWLSIYLPIHLGTPLMWPNTFCQQLHRWSSLISWDCLTL